MNYPIMVEYSDEGLKTLRSHYKIPQRSGTALKMTRTGWIVVLWDGIKQGKSYHPDFIKPITNENDTQKETQE